ncbi:hypothetical protein EDB89DRAFT_906273 [Lactarius sanguifluus]|nr:hypothetical protein EDB89DRAFT_906273 [Lactarius sanguifluus]
MCDTNPIQITLWVFAGEGLWGMESDGHMGYGMQIPAHQLGGLTFLWGTGGYGLSALWDKRGSTVIHFIATVITPRRPVALTIPIDCRSLRSVFLSYRRTPPPHSSQSCYHTIEFTQSPPSRLAQFRV